jgi:hypothetical protein
VAVQTNNELVHSLEMQLVGRYGVLLSSSAVAETLGYRTVRAYRQAVVRGTMSIKTFSVPNRRGHFALAADVARWVADQYGKAAEGTEPKQPVGGQKNGAASAAPPTTSPRIEEIDM